MSPSADQDREPQTGSVENLKVTENELLLKQEAPASLTDTSGPSPAAADESFPLADRGPYFVDMWDGSHPNYGCPYCLERQLADSPEEGNGVIELHILEKIDKGDPLHMAALDKTKK